MKVKKNRDAVLFFAFNTYFGYRARLQGHSCEGTVERAQLRGHICEGTVAGHSCEEFSCEVNNYYRYKCWKLISPSNPILRTEKLQIS